jgi:flagellar L-ring protein precursor FlgH
VNTKQTYKTLFLLCVIVLLQGCVLEPPAIPDDPEYAPVISATARDEQRFQGSLYQSGRSTFLFEDRKAHRVGDILIIVLSESTNASKKAETEIDKKTAISIAAPTILGRSLSVGSTDLSAAVAQERGFEGDASSDQSNSLQGTIAVTISNILPNGLMEVRGEKWMTLNSGEEYIRIKGLVRPEDIGPDNTILSSRVANARIAYSGTGDFANSNKQGWIARMFNLELWPF